MKQIIALFFLTFVIIGCAMTHPPIERQVIQEIQGSKDQLYDRAIYWFAFTFKDSKAVLEVKDKENGKLIGKGSTVYPTLFVSYPLQFTIAIDIKENKMRVAYTNVGVMSMPPTATDITWQCDEKKIYVALDAITQSLIKYLSGSKAETNW